MPRFQAPGAHAETFSGETYGDFLLVQDNVCIDRETTLREVEGIDKRAAALDRSEEEIQLH